MKNFTIPALAVAGALILGACGGDPAESEEYQALEAQLSVKTESLEDADTQAGLADNRIEDLEGQVERANADLEQAKADLAEAEAQIDAALAAEAEARDEADQLQDQLDAAFACGETADGDFTGKDGDRKRCDKGKLVKDPDPEWIAEQERLREQAIPKADFQAIVTPPLVAFANSFRPGVTWQDRQSLWDDVEEAFGQVLRDHTVTDDLLAPEANPEWLTAAEAVDQLALNGSGRPSDREDLATWVYHFDLPEVWAAHEQIPLSFGSGTYRVGHEPGQVPPGTYVAKAHEDHPFDGCYWATHSAGGDIIANNFLSSGYSLTAHVSGSADSVEFDCGIFWQQ